MKNTCGWKWQHEVHKWDVIKSQGNEFSGELKIIPWTRRVSAVLSWCRWPISKLLSIKWAAWLGWLRKIDKRSYIRVCDRWVSLLWKLVSWKIGRVCVRTTDRWEGSTFFWWINRRKKQFSWLLTLHWIGFVNIFQKYCFWQIFVSANIQSQRSTVEK